MTQSSIHPFAESVREGVRDPAMAPSQLDELQQGIVTDTAALVATIALQVMQRETQTIVAPIATRLVDQAIAETPERIKSTTIIRHEIPRVATPFMWLGALIGAVAGLIMSVLVTINVNALSIAAAADGKIYTVGSAFDNAWIEVTFFILIIVGFAAIGNWVGSLFYREIPTQTVIPNAAATTKNES